MSHTCHAIACEKVISNTLFMCRGHWFQLPLRYRRAIWRTFKEDQIENWSPTEEYCKAAKQCIIFIATAEGRVVTGEEKELKLYDWLNKANNQNSSLKSS